MSPLIRLVSRGRWSAAVSIRSGRGSMTHDRVMRFTPEFDSHDQASRFATEQALAWIGTAGGGAVAPRLSLQD